MIFCAASASGGGRAVKTSLHWEPDALVQTATSSRATKSCASVE